MAGFGEPYDWTAERDQRMESDYPELADTSADDLLGVDNYAVNSGGSATKFSSNAMGLGAHSAAVQQEDTSIWGRVKSAGSSLLSNVINPILALDTPLSQRAGYVTPEDAGIAEQVAGFTRDELTRPSNIALAALGIFTGGLSTGGALTAGGTRIATRTAAANIARSMGQNVLSGVAGQVAAKGVAEVAEYAPDEIGPLAGIASAAAGAYATRGRSLGVRGLATVGAGLGGYASPELAGGLAGGVLAYKGMNKLSSWKEAITDIESRTNALDDAVTQSASEVLKARVTAEADDAAEIARRAANVAEKPPISYRDLDASREMADDPAGYFGAESMAQRGILESDPYARFKTGGDGGPDAEAPKRVRTSRSEASKRVRSANHLEDIATRVRVWLQKFGQNNNTTMGPEFAIQSLGKGSEDSVIEIGDLLGDYNALAKERSAGIQAQKTLVNNSANDVGKKARADAENIVTGSKLQKKKKLDGIEFNAAAHTKYPETADAVEDIFTEQQYDDIFDVLAAAHASGVFGLYDIRNGLTALRSMRANAVAYKSHLKIIRTLFGKYEVGEDANKAPWIFRGKGKADVASATREKISVTRPAEIDEFGNLEGESAEFFGDHPIKGLSRRLDKRNKGKNAGEKITAAQLRDEELAQIAAAFDAYNLTPEANQIQANILANIPRGAGGSGELDDVLSAAGIINPNELQLQAAEKLLRERMSLPPSSAPAAEKIRRESAGTDALTLLIDNFTSLNDELDNAPLRKIKRGAIKQISVADIGTDVSNFQARNVPDGMTTNKSTVDNLVENWNIEELQPILLVENPTPYAPDGSYDGKYIVVSGHHRLAAAQELNISKLPARILAANMLDPADLRALRGVAAAENYQTAVTDMVTDYNSYMMMGGDARIIKERINGKESDIQRVLDAGFAGEQILQSASLTPEYRPVASAIGAMRRKWNFSDETAGGWFDKILGVGDKRGRGITNAWYTDTIKFMDNFYSKQSIADDARKAADAGYGKMFGFESDVAMEAVAEEVIAAAAIRSQKARTASERGLLNRLVEKGGETGENAKATLVSYNKELAALRADLKSAERAVEDVIANPVQRPDAAAAAAAAPAAPAAAAVPDVAPVAAAERVAAVADAPTATAPVVEPPAARVETPAASVETPAAADWQPLRGAFRMRDGVYRAEYRDAATGNIDWFETPPLRLPVDSPIPAATGGADVPPGGTRRTATGGGEPPSDAPGTQPALSADLAPAPTPPKPWYDHLFGDLLSIPRSLKSAFDLSAAGRQGLIPSLLHPGIAKNSFAKQIRALRSEADYAADLAQLENSSHAAARDIAGIDMSSIDNPMISGEKRIVQQTLDKIPGYRPSARAYNAYLNHLRDGLFETMLSKSGINYLDEAVLALPETQKTLREFGKLVNLSTGRLDVGEFLKSQSVKAATSNLPLLWAPQLLLSRVLLPFQVFSSNKQVRIEAAEQLLLFVGVNAALLTGVSMTGKASVELDPRSSDFGQIRVGATRIDPWAGYRPIANLVARIMSGQKKNVDTGELYDATSLKIVGDFLRTKLEPLSGTALSIASGQDIGGKKSELGFNTAVDLLAPLFLSEIFEAYKIGGVQSAALTVPSVLGVGAGTYESYSEKMDRVGLKNMNITERVEVIPALAFRQLYAAASPRDKVAIGAHGSMTGYLEALKNQRVEDLVSGKGGTTRLPRAIAIAKAEADMQRLPANLYYSKLKTNLENNLIRESPAETRDYIKEQMDKRPLDRRFAPIQQQQRALAVGGDDEEE